MCMDIGIVTVAGGSMWATGVFWVFFLWGTCTPRRENAMLFYLSYTL